MSTFQFLLLLVAAVVFYLFFKQLFSNSFPKRGIDFEAAKDNEQIGGITQIDKNFSIPLPKLSRVEQLNDMADEAMRKEDYIEADKALSSALILENDNIGVLLKQGFVLIQLNRFEEAKEIYLHIIELDAHEDMAYASLANVLHKLGMDGLAISHHLKAIELDNNYAPHYFNYANTLYDLNRKEEALQVYKKAFALDNTLREAEKMIHELS